MTNEIINLRDYGHISISIKEKMDAQHISRNALARAVNTRFEVIDKWYKGTVEKIDADVLARICFVLGCSPGEIIVHEIPPRNPV